MFKIPMFWLKLQPSSVESDENWNNKSMPFRGMGHASVFNILKSPLNRDDALAA